MSNKLTIVQVVPEMEEGGVEGETLDLAVFLARQGHNSIVISGGGRMVPYLEQGGCRHVLWPHIGEKSIRCLKYIGKLKRFLRRERVDILHLRSRLPAWIGYLAWKSLPPSRRPGLVTTFHGFYSVNFYSTIMTKGELVIAVSHTISNHIRKNYQVDAARIRLVHGGFDGRFFSPEQVSSERVETLRRLWRLEDRQSPVILLPGRLTQWKGQDMFIDSLALMKDQPFLALCVGDTGENSSFTKRLRDRIQSLGLGERVRLVGHCSDMPAALTLADLVVSASSAQPEAFGKVVIEAMAMGKPVVATAHGGSLETVIDGETGWLVPPGEPRAMAQAITQALAQREQLPKVGEKGRRWVSEHFTAESMCRKTLDVYQELAVRRRREKCDKPLTVMQLLPELDGGGVERGTLEMGKYLAEHGCRSLVVSAGGRLTGQLSSEGSEHITMRIGDKSPLTLRYILPLRRIIRDERVDILHLRSRMPAWIGYLAWKSLSAEERPRLITTFHGFYSVNDYSAIMTKGETIIAVSESIAQHIHKNYGKKENVRTILRGVDLNVFSPEKISPEKLASLRRAWHLLEGVPTLMLPGRITRLKGQDMFLQALSMLRCARFQAVLVGDYDEGGAYVGELRELIERLELVGKARLVGHCGDMATAYLLADLVVSASSKEPEAFGRTSVEAMAMGKPVVATAHGGSLETVINGENGWLAPPGDAQAMAQVIDAALAMGEETLKRIGTQGQSRVRNSLSTEKMCEQTLAVYRQCLGV
ncbi:MAG: glycosyltransferase family 4 protein [Desulfobulbaceae bacterium]|nr:glycosyltransferase family 4 protein [Desulfobulbaceae bacterium]